MAGVIFNPAYAAYDFGADHPFSPARVAMTLDLLDALGHPVQWTTASSATREDILSVHDEAYVTAVEALNDAADAIDGSPFGIGSADTPWFPGMDEAARCVTGGTLEAARRIADGRETCILQLGGGLHHAHPGFASGFCVYNDLAVAIRHLADRGEFVAYLDIDVHHGDGVQDAFYRDEHVLTISLHESGQYLYPGTGEIYELGESMGRGMAVNVPLEPFTEDESYLEVFDSVVPQALQWFSPKVLVVQAGADAHFADPLADLALTTRGFEALHRRILALAERFTGGRLLITLGGGYTFHAVSRVWTILYLVLNGLPIPDELPESWSAKWAPRLKGRVAHTLHDSPAPFDPIPRRPEIVKRNREVATRLLDSLARYWF